MASTSETDFGFAPKKKATTYGKLTRRRPKATTVGTLRHAESAPIVPTVSSLNKSPTSSPEPASSSRTLVSTKGKLQSTRKAGRETSSKPSNDSHSQPLPDPYDIYAIEDEPEEDARPKKRRLARVQSERTSKTSLPYSIPDLSPEKAPPPEPVTRRSAPKEEPSAVPPPRETPERDVQMHDAPPSVPLFSVKTTKILKNLSVSTKNKNSKKSDPEKTQIPIRLSDPRPSSSKPPSPSKPPPIESESPSLPTSAPDTIPRSQPAKTPKKRRLIDTLVEQADEESESEEDIVLSQDSPISKTRRSPALRDSSPEPADKGRTMARPVLTAKKSGPKFTYSQQRSMLAEEDPLFGSGGLGGGLDDMSSKGALFNIGRLTKSAALSKFAYLDEEEELGNSGAVRSIHELRQAGANSRFADEMDDILDRIGAPSAKASSLRKGALLELAQKMKTKEFRRQFRDHSGDGALFQSLGEETDLVCGYSILAIVVTLLAASTSAHLIQQLRSHGFAALLTRLLDQSADITQLAKDRKHNASKSTQTTLGAVKASILELPVWKPSSPTALSPRTLALKCLELLLRESTQVSEDEFFSPAITDLLFSYLADGTSNSDCWNFPNHQDSWDFALSLHVVEGLSIDAMQSRLSSKWTRKYAPIMADLLDTALSRPIDKYDELESLTLRTSINITNHNPDACQLFVDRRLLGRLAESACGAFSMVMNSMKVEAFLSKVLDSLIIMLGVMINFCVYYPPASETLADEKGGNATTSPLNQLIRVFADNHLKTADADSMEKTQLNVALGYLSILLGYLCLHDPIKERFVTVHPKKSLQPLLDSVNEFIALHIKAAEAHGDSQSGSIARLQSLADQLAARNY
ncbi:wings apart-like protein regulation of heterochromatin-domain-containing protein [Apiosordaria backusii]|uniref:Wings apart-like protein regulation of heterochromatin-domain-containing protein n=1 Tax=Apiosordaria backusii TaxID=314023 RepID=A0AA40BRR0_9PEZI|nr:wings apart-like protein regulation of heterochromatin-domain-containing protein [Apiosordaria backusii]